MLPAEEDRKRERESERVAVVEDGGIMPGSLRDRELAAGARIVSRIPISAEPLPIVTGRSFVMVGAGK
jgi:hypothetical protein